MESCILYRLSFTITIATQTWNTDIIKQINFITIQFDSDVYIKDSYSNSG